MYNRYLSINKDDYVINLLNKYENYIGNISYRYTPMDHNVVLTRDMCPTIKEEIEYIKQFPYRELIGAFNVLCVLIYHLLQII